MRGRLQPPVPTHIHTLFASFLGLWLAFLLNRPSDQDLSLWWILAVMLGGAVHVCQLQAGFDQAHPRARRRIHTMNMLTVLLSALALIGVDQLLYAPNSIPYLKIILIALVVWGWILTHAAFKYLSSERTFFRE